MTSGAPGIPYVRVTPKVIPYVRYTPKGVPYAHSSGGGEIMLYPSPLIRLVLSPHRSPHPPDDPTPFASKLSVNTTAAMKMTLLPIKDNNIKPQLDIP